MKYTVKSSTGAATEYKSKQNQKCFSSSKLIAFVRKAMKQKHNTPSLLI